MSQRRYRALALVSSRAYSYWHLLFFCILVVIMYLWRPTQNNQRYAYSALENGDEEEEEFEVSAQQAGLATHRSTTFRSFPTFNKTP